LAVRLHRDPSTRGSRKLSPRTPIVSDSPGARNATTSSPLWQRGIRKRPAGWFEADARAGRLPQVSWLVAPTAQTEHPDYFPAAGAEYIAGKLDAIAANEDLWRKTLFILTYDENDGMFDHVPPPVPPAGTTNEFVGGLPIGLGFRVPAIVVSPWSVGGYVCSDVLDHTSLIRLIEARFGVTEPNITAWRRATCGDFTTALRLPGGPPGGRRRTRRSPWPPPRPASSPPSRKYSTTPPRPSRRPTSRSPRNRAFP
jgi:phospholipase C